MNRPIVDKQLRRSASMHKISVLESESAGAEGDNDNTSSNSITGRKTIPLFLNEKPPLYFEEKISARSNDSSNKSMSSTRSLIDECSMMNKIELSRPQATIYEMQLMTREELIDENLRLNEHVRKQQLSA